MFLGFWELSTGKETKKSGPKWFVTETLNNPLSFPFYRKEVEWNTQSWKKVTRSLILSLDVTSENNRKCGCFLKGRAEGPKNPTCEDSPLGQNWDLVKELSPPWIESSPSVYPAGFQTPSGPLYLCESIPRFPDGTGV